MSDTTRPSGAPAPSFSDDPREAMASLGVTLDDSATPDDSALDALRSQLQADLEQTQGPFRDAHAVMRYWPFALALVFGAFSVVLLKPASGSDLPRLIASLLAGLTGLVCLGAAAFAPTRPGRAERVATVGLALGIASLVIEGVIASGMPSDVIDLGGQCAMTMAVVAALPIIATFFGFKRAGLPVRRRHAAALAVAGLAMASAAVWLHCPTENAPHLLFGHMSFPALLSVGLSLGLFHLFAPSRRLPT